MSDSGETRSVECGTCGHVFEDFNVATEANERDEHVLPCPSCGASSPRVLSITVTETVQVRSSVKHKMKQPGSKRPAQEGFSGDDYFRDTGEWRDVQRTVDRANDMYQEVIRDADGNIVREVHEPLSQHTGRGAAKRR